MAVVTVAFSNLRTWLQAQPNNTPNTAYELNITGLSKQDIENLYLAAVLRNNADKYVDLSTTILPSGVTKMENAFGYCTSLVSAPEIPTTVTNMENAFGYCTSLVSAPSVIPSSVKYASNIFSDCSSLVSAPEIQASATAMDFAFRNCTSLVNAPTIPVNVTDLSHTFYNCTSLVNAPTIPASVTTLEYTFFNCLSLINAPIIPDGVTSMYQTFYNCTSLDYKPIIPSSVKTSSACYENVSTINWKGTKSQAELCPNDCEYKQYNANRITYEYTYFNISISNLSLWLTNQVQNTILTPYFIYIRGLTTSNVSIIRTALNANTTKYVDLRYTTIPNITSADNLFNGCVSLIKSPSLPSSITNMTSTFSYSGITTAPTIPSNVTTIEKCFENCNITTAPILPSGLLNMEGSFKGSSITSAPTIPNTVTNLKEAFNDTSISSCPSIPDSVTNLEGTFQNTSITSVAKISSNVTNMKNCFSGCTSLAVISEFDVSLATIKNNADFQNAFYNCSSLRQIGNYVINVDSSWHVMSLKIESNAVSGKVYDNSGNSVSIASTSITRSSLKLPNLTDEILFPPSSLSDADLETIIQNVITNKYTWYKRETIDPNNKSFVLWADDPDKVKSNILPEVEYPIPESKGGTGQTSLANVTVGNATKATSAGKLTTARKTYVTLGTASTSTTRDWSGDTTIPVHGTLKVANGGTGMSTASYKNAVVVGNSSTVTDALRTIRTANGAFYATAQDGAPLFGTLPVGQGGTGATSLANITVGNSSKLGNIAVQTTSIGGATTETGNHWSYVVKAKFTSTSGYIVYSNGLKIEWGVANKTGTSGTDRIITKSFNPVFTQPPCFTFAPYFPNNNGNHWFPDVTSLSASSFTVNSRQSIDDVPIRWIAIGY